MSSSIDAGMKPPNKRLNLTAADGGCQVMRPTLGRLGITGIGGLHEGDRSERVWLTGCP